MNKLNTAEPVNLTPVIVLLVANLLAVLLTLGAVLSRTASLNRGASPNQIELAKVDRIGDIRLDKGQVKFDLLKKSGSADATVFSQVEMPQDGFLRGFGQMEKFVRELIEAGLVTATVEGDDDESSGDDEAP